MATASAAVHGAMVAAAAAAAADNNGLCVPSTSPKQQQPSATDSNEWQDIRDLLGMSSITAGSKPSGSSDPGSPCFTTVPAAAAAGSGVRNKKSSADTSPSANSGRLSKLFVNSSGGVGSGSFRINNNNNQLQPPDCPVQIQVHLSNNDIHQQPATRLRRHSLERFVLSIITKCVEELRFD